MYNESWRLDDGEDRQAAAACGTVSSCGSSSVERGASGGDAASVAGARGDDIGVASGGGGEGIEGRGLKMGANWQTAAVLDLVKLKARAFDLEVAHWRCTKRECDPDCERHRVLAEIDARDYRSGAGFLSDRQ